MRSRTELEIEARALQLRAEEMRVARQSGENAAFGATATLLVFPASQYRVNAASEYESTITHSFIRRIEVSMAREEPEYRLKEEELVTSPKGELLRYYDNVELIVSDDVMDVLSAGYQKLDEDRLRERIEPLVDRVQSSTFPAPATKDDVAEVEELVKDFDFSAAARLRTRMDALDMIEGRLEPGDFIARAVARQECFSVSERIAVGYQLNERMDV